MASHRLHRVLLAVAMFWQVWIVECQDNDAVPCSAQKASIGREFNITCTVVCHTGTYRWFNSTDRLPGETGVNLTVSERVESAAAVGGQRYACQCGETGDTQCYLIWVIPFVTFNISKEVAKLGSSVTFSCSAESYPPANNIDFFQLHHPLEHSIPYAELTWVSTGVEYHVANASRSDGGEYECVVNVKAPNGEDLQNESRTNLIVYDPPVIIETRSSAVTLSNSSGEESAILECVVENPETDLKVWVNWTTGSGSDIVMGSSYTVGSIDGGGHFLVLHKVTEDNVHPYKCQLFSSHSQNIPEDQQTVNVTVVDLQKCTETSGLHRPDDCDCSTTIIAVSVTLVVVIAAIIIINIVVWALCWRYTCKRKKDLRVDPGTRDGTIQSNPAHQYVELPVRGGSEKEEGSEHGSSADIINQNDASIHRSLSTQSKGSTTSSEEKGAPVGENIIINSASHQNTKDSETGGLEKDTHSCRSLSPRKKKSLSDQVALSPRLKASLGIGGSHYAILEQRGHGGSDEDTS